MLMIFVVSLAGAVQAKPISHDGNDFQNCGLDGGDSSTSGNIITCCVRVDAFYQTCTACIKGTGDCRTTTTWDPQKSEPVSKPPSLRDQIKQHQSTTVAPAKAVEPKAEPIVKPIKQYQNIKASPATSSSKATSK